MLETQAHMQEDDTSEDLYTSATLQAMFPRARVQKTLDAVEMACPSAKLSHLVTVLRAVAAKLFRAMDANLSEFATQLDFAGDEAKKFDREVTDIAMGIVDWCTELECSEEKQRMNKAIKVTIDRHAKS